MTKDTERHVDVERKKLNKIVRFMIATVIAILSLLICWPGFNFFTHLLAGFISYCEIRMIDLRFWFLGVVALLMQIALFYLYFVKIPSLAFKKINHYLLSNYR